MHCSRHTLGQHNPIHQVQITLSYVKAPNPLSTQGLRSHHLTQDAPTTCTAGLNGPLPSDAPRKFHAKSGCPKPEWPPILYVGWSNDTHKQGGHLGLRPGQPPLPSWMRKIAGLFRPWVSGAPFLREICGGGLSLGVPFRPLTPGTAKINSHTTGDCSWDSCKFRPTLQLTTNKAIYHQGVSKVLLLHRCFSPLVSAITDKDFAEKKNNLNLHTNFSIQETFTMHIRQIDD